MKYSLLFLSMLALLWASCNNNQSAAKNDQKGMKTSSNYKNHISIRENGLHIDSAVLLKENGEPLSEDNTIEIGEKIYCQLNISGWKVVNGRVKLGASEKILQEDGRVVTQNEDIFKNLQDASATDARVITLSAQITTLHKSVRTFNVEFRVWDKVSNAEAAGTFPFYLK